MKRKCGYCGGVLPEECLLPAEEVAAYQAEIEVIQQRRAAEKEKEEKEREEAKRRNA